MKADKEKTPISASESTSTRQLQSAHFIVFKQGKAVCNPPRKESETSAALRFSIWNKRKNVGNNTSYYCADLKVKVYVNNVRKSPEKRTLIPSLKNNRDQARSHWAGIGFRTRVTPLLLAEPQSNGPEILPASAIKQAIPNTHMMESVWRKSPFFKVREDNSNFWSRPQSEALVARSTPVH